MPSTKADIIARLQKDILPLQGFKPNKSGAVNIGLGPIKYAFPNNAFPLGAVHEFINTKKEDISASGGFIAAILSTLMRNGAATVWISAARTIFPPALPVFGIDPGKIIFIDLKNEKQIPWVMEEALKCEGIAAVIGEMREVDFTTSRRLQLAVEKSRVTGFILRSNPRNLNTTACVARWKISSLPSELNSDMPGVGFPRWNVELIKIRNGKPGSWQVEWNAGKFRHISLVSSLPLVERKKTG
jgi:protein ImuA